ncbi:MAG: hypothetical protein K0R46_2127 [Herbinix sp.]|nr:hypothetical protein [Herbinix sp.]
MSRKDKLSLFVIVLFMSLVFMFPVLASANSARPPSLIVLVNNPPGDLSIVLLTDNYEEQGEFRRSAWEGYYLFNSFNMRNYGDYKFKVTSNGESFVCTVGEYSHSYNDVMTLDLSRQKLTQGYYPFRTVLVVSIQLLITLLLEGIIFWLFGYRKVRSYFIFLAINIVTQGALNIWLNSLNSLMHSYFGFYLFFGEIFVFAAEMMAFPIFINEHKWTRNILYAFVANFVSLVAGSFMISLLPI